MTAPETSFLAAIRGPRVRPHAGARSASGTAPARRCLSIPLLLFAGVLPLAASCAPTPDASDAGDRAGADTLALLTEDRTSGTDVLLQAVSIVSEDVVWVAGHSGTWLRSLDSGETWRGGAVPGADTLEFRDVDAVSQDTAWLLSAGPGPLSRIYRTNDGGASWALQHTATDPDTFLDCLAAWDAGTAVVYGDATEGRLFVLRTEDGGETWARLPQDALPPAQRGEGGFAASGTCAVAGGGEMGWIATGNAPQARVLRTEDRGRSWLSVEVPVAGGAGAGLTTLSMRGEWGMALGGVLHSDTLRGPYAAVTEDAGRSWSPVAELAFRGPAYGSGLTEPVGPTGDPATRIGVPVVVAVGPGGVAWSPDGGGRWVLADERTHWSVAFAGPEAGWAVGPGGRITALRLVRP